MGYSPWGHEESDTTEQLHDDGIAKCSTRLCAQLWLTFGNPMDDSLRGSSVHGISLARTLEKLPFSTPGDLPYGGIKSTCPKSPVLQADSLATELLGKPIESHKILRCTWLPLFSLFFISVIGVPACATLLHLYNLPVYKNKALFMSSLVQKEEQSFFHYFLLCICFLTL